MTFYIRGDGFDPSNPSLDTMHRNGVKLVFLNRESYRRKTESGLITGLKQLHPDAYFIPDGGSNTFAVKGAAEIVAEIRASLGFDPDHIIMDIGTGGTCCGVLQALPEKTHLTAIPVLKGVNWEKTFREVMEQADFVMNPNRVTILEDYHFGGFAKFNPQLISFINDFSIRYGMPADPVYTGKLFYALADLLKKSYFGAGKTIVCIHGGGSQGIAGFNYLHGPLINT
jgi:1-aminocyclopropane-1-carboxylate deaminase